MLKLVSLISAIAWGGLAMWLVLSAQGNADRVPLYCIAGIAATGVVFALTILVAPHTALLVYCFVLSVIGALWLLPSVMFHDHDFASMPVIGWLALLDTVTLFTLPLAWPFQIRRHLQRVAEERLTNREGV